MEEEWPYPLLSKEIDARHRAKKISDGNSCSSQAVLIPRTAGWCGIDPRWKPRRPRHMTTTLTNNTWPSTHRRLASGCLHPRIPTSETDIAGELVRDAKTLWEKFRDGIVSTNQEVMAAVDSLRRKAQPEQVPPHSSTPITSQWQGGFALGNVNGPSRASYASCKATYDSSNGSRCANLTLARRICTICSQGIPTIPQLSADVIGQGGFTSLGGPTQSVPLHAPTYGTNPWQGQSMDYGGTSFGGGVQGYMDFLQQGDWLFGQYSSHPNKIPYMQALSTGLDFFCVIVVCSSFDNFIDIYIASVGSFRPKLMSGFRPYTAS
uniref:Uncharacterized protein n=1 Tax=Oryza rufipogon TaxID=4529 RepID=A0A0E0P5R8_ORYRU